MLSGAEIILFLMALLPSAVSLILLRNWKIKIENLKSEVQHWKQETITSDETLRILLKGRAGMPLDIPSDDADFLKVSDYQVSLPENAGMIYLEVNFKGIILKMNPFTRACTGYSELDNTALNFSDITTQRQQVILISKFRSGVKNNSGKSFPFSFSNRYGERLNLILNLFFLPEQDKALVLGHLAGSIPGFGTASLLPVFEAVLYQSKWPSILLEKAPKSKGMRKSRILWVSASAGKLLGIRSFHISGLQLETVSQSLASLLYRKNAFGEDWLEWQPDAVSGKSYRVFIQSNGDFTLMQILPLQDIHREIQEPELAKGESVSGFSTPINFDRLLEITEGEPAFLKDLLPSYLSALRECRTQLRRGLDDSNAEKIRFLHHKIKATIRTFGLRELEEIFQEAMQKVGNGDETDSGAKVLLMARLNSVCAETEAAIREFGRQYNLLL